MIFPGADNATVCDMEISSESEKQSHTDNTRPRLLEPNGVFQMGPPRGFLPIAQFSISRGVDLMQLKRYLMEFKGRNMLANYEKKDKVGQGTFGEVFKGRCKKTGRVVAIKRFVQDRSKQFPITEIREILLLRRVRRLSYIAELIEVVKHVDTQANEIHYFMVMPYYEADLVGLLGSKYTMNTAEKKTIFQQILLGLSGLHEKRIIHRDLKTANIMLSNEGTVKIGDFGLSRPYNQDMLRFTPTVVTLWYRCPELLLGSRFYHEEIDMWSAGCIMGELHTKRPIMQGETEIQQIKQISNLCGPLNEQTMPGFARYPLVEYKKIPVPKVGHNRIDEKFKLAGVEFVNLLQGLLEMNPAKRLTAKEALAHKYFDTIPYVLANVRDAVEKTPKQMRFELNVRNAAEGEQKRKNPASHKNDTGPAAKRPYR